MHQSGVSAARHGRISKEGTSAARHVLVQAAWAAIKTPGPLRAFYQRVKARRGAQIAIVAVARKLAMLCWQLLTREQAEHAYRRLIADWKATGPNTAPGRASQGSSKRPGSAAGTSPRTCALARGHPHHQQRSQPR